MRILIYVYLILKANLPIYAQDWIGYGKGYNYIEIRDKYIEVEYSERFEKYEITSINNDTIVAWVLDYTTGDKKWNYPHFFKTFGDIDSVHLITPGKNKVITKFYRKDVNPHKKWNFKFSDLALEIVDYDRKMLKKYEIINNGAGRELDKYNQIKRFRFSRSKLDSLNSLISCLQIRDLNSNTNCCAPSHAPTYTLIFIDYDRNRYSYSGSRIPLLLEPIKNYILKIFNE